MGSWLWCFALAYVGERLGARWDSDPTLRDWFHRFDLVIVLAGVLAVGFFLWHRLRGRRTPPGLREGATAAHDRGSDRRP